jgi:hypothetical protein
MIGIEPMPPAVIDIEYLFADARSDSCVNNITYWKLYKMHNGKSKNPYLE